MLVRGYILPAINAFEHSYMDSKVVFQAEFFAWVTIWAHIKEHCKSKIYTRKMLTSDACTKQ